MVSRFVFFWSCLGLITSCATKSTDGELPGSADLRSGYSIIHSHDGDNAYHWTTVVVTDVAMRGDLIVVSAISTLTNDYLGGGAYLTNPDFTSSGNVSVGALNNSLIYFVSKDGGHSWEKHDFLTGTAILNPFGSGSVALRADGSVIAMIGMERSRFDDTIFTFSGLGALDLDSGTWKRKYDGEFYGSVREEDGMVYTAFTSPEARVGSPDGYGNYGWQTVAAATWTMVASGGQAYAPGDCVAFLQAVGDTFGGLCQTSDSTCYYKVDPRKDAALQKDVCAPTASLGEAVGASHSWLTATALGATLAYDKNGHAKALAIRNGFGPTYDLGEGSIRPLKWGTFHDAFAGLIAVESQGGIARVYDFLYADPVAHALAVPRTPCRDDAHCPPGKSATTLQLAWMQRTGLDEHLVIHDVRTAKGQVLTFGREKGLLPVVIAKDPDCIAPTPATGIWKACYGETLCKLDDLGTCLARWADIAAVPANAGKVTAFVGANLSSCSALSAADHRVSTTPYDDKGNCTARCEGDVAVSCGGTGVMDCASLNGGTCTLDASGKAQCLAEKVGCDAKVAAGCDSKNRVFDCANGYVDDCQARGLKCGSINDQFRCLPNPDPCASKASGCFGSVSVTCLAGQTFGQMDCSSLGQTCTKDGCQDPGYTGGACSNSATFDQCVGSKFELSWSSSRRIIDCSDFGATCGSVSGVVGCLK